MSHWFWHEAAACGGRDVELFFPHDGNRAAILAAKAFCRECPVVQECLDDAMRVEGSRKLRWGIRGGLTGPERTRLFRRQRANK